MLGNDKEEPRYVKRCLCVCVYCALLRRLRASATRRARRSAAVAGAPVGEEEEEEEGDGDSRKPPAALPRWGSTMRSWPSLWVPGVEPRPASTRALSAAPLAAAAVEACSNTDLWVFVTVSRNAVHVSLKEGLGSTSEPGGGAMTGGGGGMLRIRLTNGRWRRKAWVSENRLLPVQ